MGGQNIFDLISQGISELLNSKLGFLEASGLNLFRGLAIIMIAWYGIKAAVSSAQGAIIIRRAENGIARSARIAAQRTLPPLRLPLRKEAATQWLIP